MSRSPGTLVDEITVPFTYPRQPELRATAEFASLTGKVSRSLRAAVEQQVAGDG
jgi:NitT/TauT family transport system ATP-binding protein